MVSTAERKFVHLHLHSQYSLLDGGNRLDKLVARVKELGMDAVAVTDHGNLFGAAEFYTRAKDAGIKPILGTEAYVAPDVNGPSDRKSREYTGVSDGGFHLVLLAENQTGWQNLLKLASDAYIHGFYYKPRMDKTTLAQWSEGIIAINGHLGSSLAHHLMQFVRTGDDAHYQRAVEEARWHAEVFTPNADGEPCFFIELQRHQTQEQLDINPHLIRIADELNLPLVADNDAHFLNEDDWDTHDTMCCISMGKIKSEQNRLYYPKDLFVRSPEQMWEQFTKPGIEVPDDRGAEALSNTLRIADRCNVELDFTANHAPVVKIHYAGHQGRHGATLPTDAEGALALIDAFECEHPVGSTPWFKAFCAQFELAPYNSEKDTETEDELKQQCDGALRLLTEAGAIWRYGRHGMDEDKRARMERELKVLADKLISAYFMIVWDFVNEARRRGIPSNARGSGVGTMVGYCLGLSNACPVQYGLLFERFTDPDRSEYPDIDIDICQDGRQEIIEYVRDKYGYVAQIITFNVLKAKAAVRDVGRVLDLPLPEVDKVCKLIGDGLKTTIKSALESEPDLGKLQDQNPQVRDVLATAAKLEGMTRHAGIHAAGVIMATQPLDNIIPLYKPSGSEQIVTQWDGPTCEKVGLLKMDFLGLRTLSIIERARQLINQTLSPEVQRKAVLGYFGRGQVPDTPREFLGKPFDPAKDELPDFDPLDLERLNYRDQNVLDLFRRGDTAGVFQFESGGMRSLLMAMAPDRLEDLIAANALYRPGPMELIPRYNDRKHQREQVPKVHPIVDELTADTYGIMVYQEQVMQVLNRLGGIPLRKAYSIIKAISKKKEKVINSARVDFVEGAGEQGVDKNQSNELFDLILKFAGYGFNKSHSTGYAIVAYQTAYLKTYFPIQYMAALLTYESVDTKKVVEYIDECKRVVFPDGHRGIDIKPPDINSSYVGFTVVYDEGEQRHNNAGHIRFGLSAVKGVGEKAINGILDAREPRDEAGRKAFDPFESLYDFCERVPLQAVNRSTIEALIKCGAFDEVHGIDQRAAMVETLDNAIQVGHRAASDRSSGQSSFFEAFEQAETEHNDSNEKPQVQLPTVEPWTKKELLDFEKEVTGFYVSSHPLDELSKQLDRYTTCTIAEARELADQVEVIVGGMVSSCRNVVTRKGDKMAVLTLEDKQEKIDAVAFPRTFATCYMHLNGAEDTVLFLRGKIDRKREDPQIIIEDVISAADAAAKLTRAVRVVVQDPTPARNGTSFNGELDKLNQLIREASRSANGSATADLILELRQDGHIVQLRLNGCRVAVDRDLITSIKTIMQTKAGGICRCMLLGPEKIKSRRDADVLQHDGSRREDVLAMRSSVQGDGASCASIDRY